MAIFYVIFVFYGIVKKIILEKLIFHMHIACSIWSIQDFIQIIKYSKRKSIDMAQVIVAAQTYFRFSLIFLKRRPMSLWHWVFGSFDLTSCCLGHARHITPITHQGVGFVLSLHQCTSISPTKLETFLITVHKYSLLSGLDPISLTVSML